MKGRIDWFNVGNSNTKLFHTMSNIRTRLESQKLNEYDIFSEDPNSICHECSCIKYLCEEKHVNRLSAF